MKRLLPKTLTGQTILVLLVGLSLSHILSMVIYSGDRVEALTTMEGRNMARRVANVARLANDTPSSWREKIVEAANEPSFLVWLTPESMVLPDKDESSEVGDMRAYLRSWMDMPDDRPIHIRALKPGYTETGKPSHDVFQGWLHGLAGHKVWRISFPLDGDMRRLQWLNFATDIPQANSLWSSPSLFSMIAMAVAVILFSIWAVRRLTVPLRSFAKAATRLGKDVHAPGLEETGPLEVREAARAFNEMQSRLKRLIDNRTHMLAAISHDLRTPITLLRLRSELVENAEERDKMLATLDDMETMIASTLEFARQDAESEERRQVNLNALMEAICDDLTDTGHDVVLEEPDKIIFECRPLALRRAVTNLIENALKYSGSAHVTFGRSDEAIFITVQDDGPGINETELEDVFQPFYRCEASRNLETGGTGLGLSVVQGVAHTHGGEITLENQPQGGLRACLHLPD